MKIGLAPLRPAKILVRASLLLFIGLAFMAADALAQPQKEALTRENSQGAVTVALTYLIHSKVWTRRSSSSRRA